MKRRHIGILTILAFVASFLIASYFDDNDIHLDSQFNKTILWIESLFGEKAILNDQTNNIPQTIPNTETRKQYQHVDVGSAGVCKDTSIGEVKYKEFGGVYTWVDERGITNFSSTPPENLDFQLLNYAGDKVFDYFNLDLNTERLPYDFNQKLSLKLNKLFELYGQLLDRSSLRKVDINLHVYSSKLAFDQIKKKHNMPVGDNTAGFYSHASNQAHLLLTKHDATMRTATHEAAHAINRGIIGYSPKWLNEGLAEYSEYIEVTKLTGRVYPNRNWTKNGFLSEQLLPLSVLLPSTNKDWDSKLRSRLYATSWAFVYFMMDTQYRKDKLAKIIKLEQQDLCRVIEVKEVVRIIGLPLSELQKQFNRWAKRRLKTQSI
ncbi:hypothetical protein [Colwellia sp. 20A7]|uniref:hypothetical protein n=1 Tax=Colwellia sp. 20A7 TaxID=2689569 RepID=UPI0013582C2D|nr:hypothetical protein [Colwellia sp. 20A7]